jgi:tetratricopeptide (TPR) repeat protein
MTRGLSLAIALLVSLAACSGKQKRPDPMFGIEPNTPEGAALSEWFAGDEAAANEQAENAGESAESLFVRAEIAYADGDVERAYGLWARTLRDHPAHALTRTAVSRLYAARDEVTDFERRTASLFDEIDYGALEPMTRLYVSMMHQTIEFREWKRSDSAEPFDADRFGFAARWLATPRISPWRLLDFDREFAPEKSARLAPRYLTPHTARDVEVNYDPTEPYWTSGITLYPSFRNSGIHYLETFAKVDGSSPREYLLYGNFVSAAKVWIDGELVFDRREDDYGTGKRLRQVKLTPGTHRILVKLAYQSGYRDWFDLSFVPTGDHPSDAAGIEFAFGCLPDRKLPDCHDGAADEKASIELLGDTKLPSDLEPIFVPPKQVDRAPDVALWITMLNAHFDGEHEFFEAAWNELRERREAFAAGWALWAEQVETLWQVPSRLRDPRSLQAVRKAYELHPDSIRFASRLGAELSKKGEDREARELLEAARDGATDGSKLRAVGPLSRWARYLDDQGWESEAEEAWRAVLKVDPTNCGAARRVQTLLYDRSDYQMPEAITPEHELCPRLRETYLQVDPTDVKSRIEFAQRDWGRYPLRAGNARQLSRLLWQAGEGIESAGVIQEAFDRVPDSAAIYSELADRAFARGDTEEALKILDHYRQEWGNSSWVVRKRSNITGEIPLTDLMADGRKAAMEAVESGKEKALSNDEAYFVVDFAARKYFEDGSNLTLTHTVVRVMTKGAIDRYGEQSLPGNAQVLLARTIKQDGSVRVPEETAGKSTLSMPGLAEGDFVEVAYLQYEGSRLPPSEIQGVRFFFRMANISTLHSEYVVIGQLADFMLQNDAPTPQKFTYQGEPAVRFLATDNPRPRSEPRTVPTEEYLPWIQMYRHGETIDELEITRRAIHESIVDSSKTDAAFEEQFRAWTEMGEGPASGSLAWLKKLFYDVAAYIPDPSIGARSFNTDVNHAILSKDGNSMLVLKVVLDRLGVENDVYLAKSAYQVPEEYPVREAQKYREVLLRTVVPETGDVVWLVPDGPDAMFGAISPSVAGQPAICVTCDDRSETTVPESGFPQAGQSLEATATLNKDGHLQGTATFGFDGTSAASIRGGLRSRTDETSRQKFVNALAAGAFAGAAATSYRIENEQNPDVPLEIVVDFVVQGFARAAAPGTFQIETRLFREGLASLFGSLPQRTTPMMVSFRMNNEYSLKLKLDGWSSAEVVSPSGERRFDTRFGSYRRTTTLDGDTLTVTSRAEMPIQRVAPAEYLQFQKWALAVEQSSTLLVQLHQ